LKPEAGWFTLVKGDGTYIAEDVTASTPLSVYTVTAKAGVLCRSKAGLESATVGRLIFGDTVLVDQEKRLELNGNLRVHCVAPADCWFTAERDLMDGNGLSQLATCVGRHDAEGMGMVDEEIGRMFGEVPVIHAAKKPRKMLSLEQQQGAAALLQEDVMQRQQAAEMQA
jgi:hypothetical protein